MYNLELLVESDKLFYLEAVKNPANLSLEELGHFKNMLSFLNSDLVSKIPPHAMKFMEQFVEVDSAGTESMESFYAGLSSGMKFCLHVMNSYLSEGMVEPLDAACTSMLAYTRTNSSSLERFERIQLSKLDVAKLALEQLFEKDVTNEDSK
jgi:hypothetical protein